MGTIAGMAKLYSEAIRIQEKRGLNFDDALEIATARAKNDFINEKKSPASAVKSDRNTESLKPWLVKNDADPDPKHEWYIPARYFARQLVKEDSTLLLKRAVLADKVSQSLAKVGILKRGGKLRFEAGTILKALSNVSLG